MVAAGRSFSSVMPEAGDEKPVIVRVKRKASHSPLDAFWLEINDRPAKRPLLDFGKLSISQSDKKEDLKPKKVFVRHVETVASSQDNVSIVQSVLSNEPADRKPKTHERRQTFKQCNLHKKERRLSKSVQQQQDAAENSRFEQIWRRRKGNKDDDVDRPFHDMCRLYDVVRVDSVERSTNVPSKEDVSFESRRQFAGYMPLLRELVPAAADEIESEGYWIISKQPDEYIYDYYVVNDDMDIDDELLHPFPLIQVEDEDFYGDPDDSDYDSEDSNDEYNPRNCYPDEMSGAEESDDSEEEEEIFESYIKDCYDSQDSDGECERYNEDIPMI